VSAPSRTPFRTLILDEDPVHRERLSVALDRDGRFTLVGDAGLRFGFPLSTLWPDLVIVDPITDGRLDLRYLRLLPQQAPQAHVVVYTTAWEAAALGEVLLLGVRGFLPKLPTPPADLGDQLAQAAAGAIVVLGVPIVEALRTEFVATRLLGPQIPAPELDTVERQVLRGLVMGQSAKVIAMALTAEGTKISARSVQRISQRLQERFGVQTIGQLCAEAVRRGVV